MIRNVLVPLDRSALAEQALPPAIAIARRAQGQLYVLHVRSFTPPLAFQHVDWWSDAVLQEERDYLNAIAERIKETSGITPVVETREGSVADVIRRHAGNVGADLIVMTTHGRTGISRAWLGSVADAVVRQDSTPVLMVRPEENAVDLNEHPLYSHILIPLDGSPAAEIALDDAMTLGSLAHARYTLARVVAPVLVPVHSYALAGPAIRPDEDATSAEMQSAREYLAGQAERLKERGLHVQTTVRLGGHPAETILSVAHDVQADLIAICTHRHGAARFIMGSVADKVLRGGELPLLMMRPRRIPT